MASTAQQTAFSLVDQMQQTPVKIDPSAPFWTLFKGNRRSHIDAYVQQTRWLIVILPLARIMLDSTTNAEFPVSVITIRHVTTYKYRRAVAFGDHRLMLRPRDDEDQKVLKADIEITPAPVDLTWTRDRFGNHVALAQFAARASELRFESNIRLDHAPAELREADIQDCARVVPVTYPAAHKNDIAHFMSPRSLHPQLDRWASEFLRRDGPAATRELLRNVTRTINTSFKHQARHDKGVQDPLRTLTLRTGSCRDHAVLMIAALRSLGIAARFVSGYLLVSDNDKDDDAVGGNTHAWVQAYLPGPGWVDLDPSTGIVGNQRHVRVAVVQEPHEAIPLHGTWIGTESDLLGMSVTVKVTRNAGPR